MTKKGYTPSRHTVVESLSALAADSRLGAATNYNTPVRHGITSAGCVAPASAWPLSAMRRGARERSALEGYCYLETALSAFTWPWPLNPLLPGPPWHTCGAPLSTAGKGAYIPMSGHAIGSAVFCSCAVTAPTLVTPLLTISATTPATSGEAIEVPCR